jgi:hypothetical protein
VLADDASWALSCLVLTILHLATEVVDVRGIVSFTHTFLVVFLFLLLLFDTGTKTRPVAVLRTSVGLRSLNEDGYRRRTTADFERVLTDVLLEVADAGMDGVDL